MAYRYGDHRQKILFPHSIDEYIPYNAPVRAYDVIIDSLDFDAKKYSFAQCFLIYCLCVRIHSHRAEGISRFFLSLRTSALYPLPPKELYD